MFRFNNVYFKDILKNINLSIENNEMIGITGESGSGKSTFLKLFNKFNIPSKGNIYYDDKNILNIKSNILRKEVIMMPEAPYIYGKTINDFLYTSLSYNSKENVSKDKKYELLNLTNLNKNLNDSTSTLSSGEAKRLVLASMMLLKPKFLLLDEPVNSLDKDLSDKIMKNLYEYFKINDISIIYISHNRSQLEKYSTSIIEVSNKEVKKIE